MQNYYELKTKQLLSRIKFYDSLISLREKEGNFKSVQVWLRKLTATVNTLYEFNPQAYEDLIRSKIGN